MFCPTNCIAFHGLTAVHSCLSMGEMDLDRSVATADVRGATEAAAGVRYRLASHHREQHWSCCQCGELLLYHARAALGFDRGRGQRGLVSVVHVPLVGPHLPSANTIQQVHRAFTACQCWQTSIHDPL